MTSERTPISRETLDQRIRSEVAALEGHDLDWWHAHRVEPFLLPRWSLSPYAVALSDGIALVFFDVLDEFGSYSPERWNDSLILYGSLADAVRRLATRDSMTRVFAETTASLLRLGILDRGDSDAKSQAMEALAAFGPAAAVAVPKIVEIMSQEALAAGLHEQAVATLAKIGPGAADAVPKLIMMAELDTANARARCLTAFESIGPAAVAAVPFLIDFLMHRPPFDPDPFDIKMTADALGNIMALEALPALLQTLAETDDPEVAFSIIRAIGKLGPDATKAAPILAAFVGSHPEDSRFREDAFVQKAASEALRRVVRPRPVNP